LRSPRTIRERCHAILAEGELNRLKHFSVDKQKLPVVVDYVIQEIKANYPDLEIPYHSRWRHFDVGDVGRIAMLDQALQHATDLERGRCKFDLVITSVLLDAGAGDGWRFTEASSGKVFSRSEGLAVASFHMFSAGAFSSDANEPLRVDAAKLKALSNNAIENAFQVSHNNPLVGVEGRTTLLRQLGVALEKKPQFFGKSARLGNLFDYLHKSATARKLPARDILLAVLQCLGSIWPGRMEIDCENLGDVWQHYAIKTNDETSGLVPFHKLSQWLTYSLLEPLEEAGIKVTHLEELTGLPEYRNGGLFLDLNVIKPKQPGLDKLKLTPDAEIIVEWRALTVALLDEVAREVRTNLGLSAEKFPLAKVLQGGTWSAGRKIAAQLRNGKPPLNITSDGTVF
jgi:hypothetical protein